jgi:hypothetical protein
MCGKRRVGERKCDTCEMLSYSRAKYTTNEKHFVVAHNIYYVSHPIFRKDCSIKGYFAACQK